MKSLAMKTLSIGLLLLVVWIPRAWASEIVLRPAARPEGHIVCLGDLAEIRGIDTTRVRQLEALPLMPAPAPGTIQFLRLQQVRELLVAHGEDLGAHHIRGASQVRIGTDLPARPLARRILPKKLTTSRRTELRAAVASAILESLHAEASPDNAWQIAFELTEPQYNQLSEASTPITVHGGESPWTGLQYLTVRFETSTGPAHLPLVANVTLPEPVVVAIRAIHRGAMVREADVALRRVPSTSKHLPTNSLPARNQPFRQLNQVIGTEAKRSIRVGEVLTQQVVQWPTVVARGDTVKITARTGGVRVCTYARARESGSRGDLIVVESLEDRERFMARVVGLREVEVFANSIAATDYANLGPDGAAFPKRTGHASGSGQIPDLRRDRPRPGPIPEDGLVAKQPGISRQR